MIHPHSSPTQMERVVSPVHTEMVPGTKIMTDVQGSRFIHAHNSASSTVLVPQPTEDIHDPLVSWFANFLRRRHLHELQQANHKTELEPVLEDDYTHQSGLFRCRKRCYGPFCGPTHPNLHGRMEEILDTSCPSCKFCDSEVFSLMTG